MHIKTPRLRLAQSGSEIKICNRGDVYTSRAVINKTKIYLLGVPQSTHASFPETLFFIQCILKASVSFFLSPSLFCKLDSICCSIAVIQLSLSSALFASKCQVLFSKEMIENSKLSSGKKGYIKNN